MKFKKIETERIEKLKIKMGKQTGRGHKKVPENFPEPLGKARDLAAKEVGISGRETGGADTEAGRGKAQKKYHTMLYFHRKEDRLNLVPRCYEVAGCWGNRYLIKEANRHMVLRLQKTLELPVCSPPATWQAIAVAEKYFPGTPWRWGNRIFDP